MTRKDPKRHPWGEKVLSEGQSEGEVCYACGQPATASILLAHGPHSETQSVDPERLYIPNQMVRTEAASADLVEEYWFCHPCIRYIEDNMRSSILYLQAEAGTVAVTLT